MKINGRIKKGIAIGLIVVGFTGGMSLAQPVAEDGSQNIKIVNSSVSPRLKSKIYDLNNSASLVINKDLGIYELFVEELGDWSVECSSEEELLLYANAYNKYKNDYKNYDNKNVTYEEECCEYRLSNGITIIKSEDIETKDVYLPIFGGDLPYKTNSLEDAKKVVDTYLEGIGE